ncbi:hypothetical protein [Psychrilyobacter atlanticus]|uniref:hypothetical protein n=1 Tax=Psychrilyobacter atlanticus TaxID=271091 RepID=UPI000402A801|nr:hypothetical protein [Psychrilyobacter atlanticus]
MVSVSKIIENSRIAQDHTYFRHDKHFRKVFFMDMQKVNTISELRGITNFYSFARYIKPVMSYLFPYSDSFTMVSSYGQTEYSDVKPNPVDDDDYGDVLYGNYYLFFNHYIEVIAPNEEKYLFVFTTMGALTRYNSEEYSAFTQEYLNFFKRSWKSYRISRNDFNYFLRGYSDFSYMKKYLYFRFYLNSFTEDGAMYDYWFKRLFKFNYPVLKVYYNSEDYLSNIKSDFLKEDSPELQEKENLQLLYEELKSKYLDKLEKKKRSNPDFDYEVKEYFNGSDSKLGIIIKEKGFIVDEIFITLDGIGKNISKNFDKLDFEIMFNEIYIKN